MGRNGNRDVGKMGMGVRYRTGNGMGMGMIPLEWKQQYSFLHTSINRCLFYFVVCTVHLCRTFAYTQAYVSSVQSVAGRPRQAFQVRAVSGHRQRWWLPIQVPQLALGGSGQGRPGDAQANVRPSRLASHRRTLDEQSRIVPQTQTHQQHRR